MRVLVVDDSPASGIATQGQLEAAGIAVDYAQDNFEALSFLYAGGPYHAIVQDVDRSPDGVIPDEGGAAGVAFYFRYLVTICPDMPVIFYTGYDRDFCVGGDYPPTCTFVSKRSFAELLATLQSVVAQESSADAAGTAIRADR